jgi:hypothetical protein
MLSRSILAPALLAALGAAAGCNSFDPAYGDEPFRCGEDEPTCPDGYTCAPRGADDGVCVRKGDAPAPDGGPDAPPPPPCRIDAEEPNDARNVATVTPVPDQAPDFVLDDLTMCAQTDHDFFQFGLPTNSRLRITVDSDSEALDVKILLVNGTQAGTGRAVNGNVTVFQAPGGDVPQVLAAGVYYVDVSSPTASFSAYRIEIETCPAAQATCLDD